MDELCSLLVSCVLLALFSVTDCREQEQKERDPSCFIPFDHAQRPVLHQFTPTLQPKKVGQEGWNELDFCLFSDAPFETLLLLPYRCTVSPGQQRVSRQLLSLTPKKVVGANSGFQILPSCISLPWNTFSPPAPCVCPVSVPCFLGCARGPAVLRAGAGPAAAAQRCQKPTLICTQSLAEGKKHLGEISRDKMWAGGKTRKWASGCVSCFSRCRRWWFSEEMERMRRGTKGFNAPKCLFFIISLPRARCVMHQNGTITFP